MFLRVLPGSAVLPPAAVLLPMFSVLRVLMQAGYAVSHGPPRTSTCSRWECAALGVGFRTLLHWGTSVFFSHLSHRASEATHPQVISLDLHFPAISAAACDTQVPRKGNMHRSGGLLK